MIEKANIPSNYLRDHLSFLLHLHMPIGGFRGLGLKYILDLCMNFEHFQPPI
jgi:hypothetical protein